MSLLNDFLTGPFGDTPAEAARKRGDLIYYEPEGRWIDLTEEDDPR